MKFTLLDQVRCSCGNEELQLEGAVTTQALLPEPAGMACRKYCGLRQVPVRTTADRSPECLQCQRQTILQGTIRCRCGEGWQIVDGIPSFFTRFVDRSPSSRLRVVETNPRTDPRWEPFVASHPGGSACYHPGWLKALEEEYGQTKLHLACEDLDGRLMAVLPMFYTRGLPLRISGQPAGRRISSLPRSPIGGPLSIDGEATSALLKTALERSHERPGTRVKFLTRDSELAELASGLTRTPWRNTWILELPQDPQGLPFGNSANRHRVKWAVNKAVKLGVRVREAESEGELRAWYRLYLEVRRRHAAPTRPYRFFRAIWELLHPTGVMSLLLAELDQAGPPTLLAGSIFLTFGSTTFYAFTGATNTAFAFHPNDIIQWQAIHDACNNGSRLYDFGEVPEESPQLANFKRKWGAEPSPLYRYFYPALQEVLLPQPAPGWIRRISAAGWRHLPLDVTEKLGDWIYSYL